MLRDSKGPDRFWHVCNELLPRALEHLATEDAGLDVMVLRCMPLRENKVRSLRGTLEVGTPPCWRRDLHSREFFVGAESLAGWYMARILLKMLLDCEQMHLHHATSSFS